MLTKTERTLLIRAASNQNGITSVISGVVTSRKRGAYGVRERDAARSLKEKGLFIYMNSHRSTHYLCHGFGSDIGNDTIWKITQAGRDAIA